jgi:single-strand DNA-binding protein
MADINNVVLVGRLTRDMELRQTSGGTSVGTASIAVNRWNGKEEEAGFFDVRLWGKQADSLSKYLIKGTQIAVCGELVQERWEKDGEKRSKVLVNASRIQLLGSKAGASAEKHESTEDIPF